jgi:hypothetical protein
MSDKNTNRKNDPSVGHRNDISEAIRKIALKGIADPDQGFVYGSRRITGYVAKVNDDLTIDVQEYLDEQEFEGEKIGYHEGVYLSALESNPNGYVIVPKLYSEVVIVKDPVTKTEYVSMFSHVDVIQLESSDSVTIGVVEREDLDLNDDNSPDVDELEPTGLSGKTTYSKDEVKTEVADEDGSKDTFIDMKSDSLDISVSDGDESTAHFDKGKIVFERGKSKTTLEDGANTMENGNEMVKVTNSTVYLGSDSGTSHAVLGEELADILADILDYCSQIKTTTMLGPQPVLPPTIVQFIALKTKISVWKSTISNFLTRKVEVQK